MTYAILKSDIMHADSWYTYMGCSVATGASGVVAGAGGSVAGASIF